MLGAVTHQFFYQKTIKIWFEWQFSTVHPLNKTVQRLANRPDFFLLIYYQERKEVIYAIITD